MSLVRKILLAAGIVILAIQFLQPKQNNANQVSGNDISKIVFIPDSVQMLLKTACYDCHSNNTDYPWYSYIQPIGWLMANHIKQGKGELNFSEFGHYSPRRQLSKLEGIGNSIKDDIMPLPSYRFMHENARLTLNNKTLILNWIRQTIDSINVTK